MIMKKITKIICTLGPACNDVNILNEMSKEGMDIARLNMSHGTLESHQGLIDKIADLRAAKKVKLMIDTKGPEIRIGTFENGSIELRAGDKFTFTRRDVVGNQNIVKFVFVKTFKGTFNLLFDDFAALAKFVFACTFANAKNNI